MASRRVFIALLAMFMAVTAHAAGRGMLDLVRAEVACPTSGVDPACGQCSAAGGDSVVCAVCSENSYLVHGVCMCNPGFGYRYSAHYCSKCPKGQLHCNDEYMLDARGAMGEQWRAGMQTATSNWLG